MPLESVPVDLQEEFEILKRSRGWVMLIQHVKGERESRNHALINAPPGEMCRIAALQAEIRVYEWLLTDALSQIEASMTKEKKK